jgi:radial spoke head protein 1
MKILTNFSQEYIGDRSPNKSRHGFGKALLPNRDQYQGEYRNGKRHGTGTYQFKNGACYDGEWKNGFKHGNGKFSYPDGSWFNGKWKNGMKNGFGKYFYENCDVYEGTWKDDLKHGVGNYKFQEAEISMKATWFEGVLRGPIEIVYPDCRYHGFWKEKFPIGEGVYSFDMKFMLPGYIEMFPNPNFVESKQTETENENKETNLIPRCLPRFIAEEIQVYDYSKLPQQPISLPQNDSTLSLCSQSSKSDSDDQIKEIHPSSFTIGNGENSDCDEIENEVKEENENVEEVKL